MPYKMYTYDEALSLIKPELNALKARRKLKELCNTYDLSYHVVQQLSSDSNCKQFPDTLVDLLHIFGYDISREKAFKVKGPKDIGLK